MIRRLLLLRALILALACVSPAVPARAASSSPGALKPATLAALALPGEAGFVTVARDILALRFAVDPSMAAGDGLFEDAARVPSFAPDSVAARLQRLQRDMAALRSMPWRRWEVDRQVDWRWVYANAEDVRLQLAEEKLYLHRPSSWLEPLANTYISLLTYAPERADLRLRLARGIPGMVAEMRAVVRHPTARDSATARGVIEGIVSSLRLEAQSADRDAAIAALSDYVKALQAPGKLPEFAVIGRKQYNRRLQRALLLPWSAHQLLGKAKAALAATDSAMAVVAAGISPSGAVPPAPPPTPEQIELARNLDQEKLLAIYDGITAADRAFLDHSDLLTVPPEVGPIHSRVTPEAMIPLTGDGGSMNPPPPIGSSNVGWWNVGHFKPEWTLEQRTDRVVRSQDWQQTGMGPYAAHEGVPGHHLQLSIARLNPNPLRSLLSDGCMVEGWAMYAEEVFWRAGGLGDSQEAAYRTLGSWRGRIRRVFYDVNVECGDWTLQEAADFKYQKERGQGEVDEDILRAINWPAQLIGYFAGKTQLMELKAAYRAKAGAAYSERRFNDAVLAEGSIPVALIRAKLLGEAIPAP